MASNKYTTDKCSTYGASKNDLIVDTFGNEQTVNESNINENNDYDSDSDGYVNNDSDSDGYNNNDSNSDRCYSDDSDADTPVKTLCIKYVEFLLYAMSCFEFGHNLGDKFVINEINTYIYKLSNVIKKMGLKTTLLKNEVKETLIKKIGTVPDRKIINKNLMTSVKQAMKTIETYLDIDTSEPMCSIPIMKYVNNKLNNDNLNTLNIDLYKCFLTVAEIVSYFSAITNDITETLDVLTLKQLKTSREIWIRNRPKNFDEMNETFNKYISKHSI